MNKPNTYSESWIGQDGREWRDVGYWNGFGWQHFLQVKNDGIWTGY